ncbi:MAG: hypothetical protein NTW66_03780 [Candidatus Magasanikbacteria bacterium]|nr:hypothetical protein [Candidatus Magasanikbacteria bacterium]
MDLITVIGILGAASILLCFILNQSHIWKDTDLKYDLLNFIGSSLLVVYGILIHAYPFVVLNGVWAIVSLKDVIIDLRKMKI